MPDRQHRDHDRIAFLPRGDHDNPGAGFAAFLMACQMLVMPENRRKR
jgi:hypothetical protein